MVTEPITLPSGKKCQLRKGKGRDYMHAQRQVVNGKNGTVEPGAYNLAIIAELATVDDKRIVFEDVLEMDLDDVQAILAALYGGKEKALNFPIPPEPASPASSSSDSAQQS